jgi:Outer membrane protein beta-barrel domain
MHLRRRIGLVVVVFAGLGLATAARAEWVIVPPRAGQVGLSIQGQYGQLLPGEIGDDFDNGPGLAVRLRYRMRYERALGLTFESQRFNAQTPTVDDTLPKYTSFYMYGIDVYQMFDTRSKTTKMLGVGLGLCQARLTLNDKEIQFTNADDGLYVTAIGGIERFFWQSWAIDLSARYYAAFLDGKLNHDLQGAIGVIFYASY